MPTGCDFTCDNEKCQHHKKGFILRSSWPLGNIDKVIMAKNVRINKEFQKELIEFKKSQGRQQTLINYPNVDRIPVEGVRVNLWCPKCKYIDNHDVKPTDPKALEGKTDSEAVVIMDEIVANTKVEETPCPRCKGKMKTFSELMKDDQGIDCPSCGVKMTKNTFFSNETHEEFTRNAK